MLCQKCLEKHRDEYTPNHYHGKGNIERQRQVDAEFILANEALITHLSAINSNNNNNNNAPVATKYQVDFRQGGGVGGGGHGIAMSYGQMKCSLALVGNHLEMVPP